MLIIPLHHRLPRARDRARFGARTATRLALAVLLVTVPAACTGDLATPSTNAITHDSAGVRIVENALPRWAEGEGWEVLMEPALSIGVVEGDPNQEFNGIAGAWRLSDGRVVVADRGTMELRFFDPAGTHLSTVGGRGEGPGEFTNLGGLQVVRGDTLVAYNQLTRRVTLFDGDGSYVRTVSLPSLEDRPWARPRGTFADGSLLLSAEAGYIPSSPEGEVVEEPALYLRFDLRTEAIDTVGEFPVRRYWAHPMMALLIPHEPEPAMAAAGDALYFGRATDFEIDIYSSNGELQRSVRWLREPTPVTSADLEAYQRETLERIEHPDMRRRGEEALRDMFGSVEMPETVPAHSELRVDEEGYLWVADYHPAGSAAQGWTVLAPDGTLLGPVRTPEGLEIHQIGGDFVLGTMTGSLGVERVVLHELLRQE
jgi:hypothetical protein